MDDAAHSSVDCGAKSTVVVVRYCLGRDVTAADLEPGKRQFVYLFPILAERDAITCDDIFPYTYRVAGSGDW